MLVFMLISMLMSHASVDIFVLPKRFYLVLMPMSLVKTRLQKIHLTVMYMVK